MEMGIDHNIARALLEWQLEMGASEAIAEAPINRYELPDGVPSAKPVVQWVPGAAPTAVFDAAAVAREMAQAAATLEDLRAALAAFKHCELKRGARNSVFADGNPQARVMIIGEAPGREEDIAGTPFVGRAGQLLDKMLAAIGLARDAADSADAVYVTNILPWRPPQDRTPEPGEVAMMLPFMKRHVELVAPKVLVLMGNVPCQAVLGKRGVTRLRGNWQSGLGCPVMPMFHPAYLLRNPAAKRDAWHDLLMLQAKLKDL
ncbi:MAG: uracil-DNA glycosylase [Paracoccaceae bacterium]